MFAAIRRLGCQSGSDDGFAGPRWRYQAKATTAVHDLALDATQYVELVAAQLWRAHLRAPLAPRAGLMLFGRHPGIGNLPRPPSAPASASGAVPPATDYPVA